MPCCIFEVKRNRSDKEVRDHDSRYVRQGRFHRRYGERAPLRSAADNTTRSNTMSRRGCMTRIVAVLASVSSRT
jgi:hypothetical protein